MVVLFRNPEFQLEFLVTNFPEQNRTGILENSLFRRRISGCPDIRLNPNFYRLPVFQEQKIQSKKLLRVVENSHRNAFLSGLLNFQVKGGSAPL